MTVLVRAVGPTLADFGVPAVLAEPRLTLYSGSQLMQTNAGWGTAPNAASIRETVARIDAHPLSDDSADSVLLTRLSPGAYTLHVGSADGTTGVVLVEVYAIDQKENGADPRLIGGRPARCIAGSDPRV